MYQQQTVWVDDLAADPRWPELARRVTAELGIAIVLFCQLFVHANDLGSLNLLARRRNAFTDESERVGLLFRQPRGDRARRCPGPQPRCHGR